MTRWQYMSVRRVEMGSRKRRIILDWEPRVRGVGVLKRLDPGHGLKRSREIRRRKLET